jgi:DNA invertase Pin-like site-specific DNA recombinase
MDLPEKVQGRHLDRLAMVYVRQSSLRQVEQNQESTRLQYALVERAQRLGWARGQIEVIDDDLGRSGASAADRPGFQRLVAEVGLGHVGLVLGVEMSRLARSCRDWHQLLEICALSDTLLADADAVYNASHFNDRLLLGLKGTISEAELHILKARMHEGRRAKARRGELFFVPPRGYMRGRAGDIVLDEDEQVRATVQLVFDSFERCRTINGVLRYFVAHDLRLPCRVRSGSTRGELEWRRPSRNTIADMLQSPIYAGAYVYGRRAARAGSAGPASSVEPVTLIKDRLPAYIDWEIFERNRAQMAANQTARQGVARGGGALLAGLVVCGRCGQRMSPTYPNGGHRYHRYDCSRQASTYGAPHCQSLSGRALDRLVEGLLLQALTPSALAVSLQLAEDLELERAALHRQWRQRLERARYEAERARRQYDAVEPENRLVARTLEGRWETALAEERRLQTEYERFLAVQPLPPSVQERAAICRLAEDVPALWAAATTTAADRQAITRLMLERVVITVQGETETVAVECHWAGGVRTRHELRRPVARLSQLSDHEALLARVRALHAQGHKTPAIAAALNAEGWTPPKRRATYNASMVHDLLKRLGVPPAAPRLCLVAQLQDRAPGELSIDELAVRLGMPRVTVQNWASRGLVKARKAQFPNHPQGVWLIQADETEIERLRERRRNARTFSTPEEA